MIRIMTAVMLLGFLGPRAEASENGGDAPVKAGGTPGGGTPVRVGPKRESSGPERWQYAGENHGIRFFFQIANECRESGGTMAVKLESTLDYPVTVSFRINDPNWSKTFERDLPPGEKDTGLKFTPSEGTVCHPYVDEVFVDTKETQVTKTGSGGAAAEPAE